MASPDGACGPESALRWALWAALVGVVLALAVRQWLPEGPGAWNEHVLAAALYLPMLLAALRVASLGAWSGNRVGIGLRTTMLMLVIGTCVTVVSMSVLWVVLGVIARRKTTWVLEYMELTPGHDAASMGGALPASVMVLLTITVVPFCEEWLFRGALLSHLAKRMQQQRAICSVAAVFALLHFDPVGAFVMGVVSGMMALRHGLAAAVWIHASTNASAHVAIAALARIGDERAVLLHMYARPWVGAIVALISGGVLLLLLRDVLPKSHPVILGEMN